MGGLWLVLACAAAGSVTLGPTAASHDAPADGSGSAASSSSVMAWLELQSTMQRAFVASQSAPTAPKIYVYPPFTDHPFHHLGPECPTPHDDMAYGSAFEQLLPRGIQRLPSYVTEPEQADLFVLAHDTTCYTMQLAQMQGGLQQWAQRHGVPLPSPAGESAVYEHYLRPYIRHIQSLPYLARRGGADHVVVAAKDMGICHWPPELVNALNGTIVVQAHGQIEDQPARSARARWTNPSSGPCYMAGRCVVVPPGSNLVPARYVEQFSVVDALLPTAQRPRFASFSGSAPAQPSGFSNGARQLLAIVGDDQRWASDLRLEVWDRSNGSARSDYRHPAAYSKFGLCAPGWGIWSPRPVVNAYYGAIPVLLWGDGLVMPYERWLPYRNFTLKLAAASTVWLVPLLKDAEEARGPNKLRQMQVLGRRLGHYLTWHGDPRDNAVAMTVLEVACRFFWPRRGMQALAREHCGGAHEPIAWDAWL